MVGIKGKPAPCRPGHFLPRDSQKADAILEGRAGQTGNRRTYRVDVQPVPGQAHSQGPGHNNNMKEDGIFLKSGRK